MELEGIEALLLASRQPQLNREFQLRIVQEPLRARMCGHGDKDRRPITPPLIAKLICVDTATGEEVPVEDVDTSFFIMSADLRTDEFEDANLVHPPTISNVGGFADHHRPPFPTRTRHSHSTSISSVGSSEHSHATQTAWGHFRDSPSPGHHTSSSVAAASPPPFPTKRSASPPFHHHHSTNAYDQYQRALSSHHHPDEYPTPISNGLVAGHSPPLSHNWSPNSSRAPSPLALPPLAECNSPNKKRKTSPDADPAFVSWSPDADVLDFAPGEPEPVPNLIGSLHTSAFKLKDERGAPGIFFFWPDLSVRTEGVYRLRLRFLSIGAGGTRIDGGSPVVASTYSQPFTVSSAKRFEGMLDPTSMSRCFAKQGIRIPTRKVKLRKKRGDDDEAER